MSFLRKDKSRNNLRILNGGTAGQYSSDHRISEAQSEQGNGHDNMDEPPLPMTGNFNSTDGNGMPIVTGPGDRDNSRKRPGLGKRSSSNAVCPTASSSSSSASSNDRHDTGDNHFPLSSKFSEFEESPMAPENPIHSRRSFASPVCYSNYSPRSSISGPASQTNSDSEMPGINDQFQMKENYRGFHANKRPKGLANIPPLSHPIKPRFKKKGGYLLGKLIYSARKDSESLNTANDSTNSAITDTEFGDSPAAKNRADSVGSQPTNQLNQQTSNKKSGSSVSSNTKHKFRIPSMSLDHHHHAAKVNNNDTSQQQVEAASNKKPQLPLNTEVQPKQDLSKKKPTSFDLDMDLNEMHGIVKPPTEHANHTNNDEQQQDQNIDKSYTFTINETPESNYQQIPEETRGPLKFSYSNLAGTNQPINNQSEKTNRTGGGWKAPESWDVKINSSTDPGKIDSGSLSDSDSDEKENEDDRIERTDSRSTMPSLTALPNLSDDKSNDDIVKSQRKHQKKFDESQLRANLPVLYGSRHSPTQPGSSNLKKGPNHIVRVFKEDNTFTTILCPIETTTTELLNIVQRKFFLESTANYQISIYIGNCVKVLESFEQPLKIQMGLLMLSGYSDKDNLKIIGREDLSYVCKFVAENIYLRSLTQEEETILSRDYIDVDISSSNLKNIPIIFHQHTYEIEKLNVADNPSIYIPLDFIQSCNNLTSIVFSRNGCSKFPSNFIEAKKLIYLDMEKNFLDEIPSKISHLKNLTNLKLNSNQLRSLPKSFGRLQNLTTLNLSSNYFNTYPEAISELVNLKDLDLSYNDLSFLPESLGRLKELSKLNLCTNKLSKSLPPYFANLISLKRLDIRYNKITNVDVLGLLPNLEVAYASKNKISAFSDKMESLRLLHFDRNPITNLQFENLLPKLTVLDLSKAKLTSIPSEFISKIKNVEKLVLDKNHLVNLPNELGDLTKLTYFSVYGNNLQVLPATIGRLTNLQYLDLHSNNLQLLPNDIWNLKSLSLLNVSSNILASLPKPPLAVAKRISSSVNFRQTTNPTLDFKSPSEELSISSAIESETPSIKSPNEGSEFNEMGTTGSDLDNEGSSSSVKFGNTSSSLADSLLSLTLADNRLGDDCFEPISFFVELKVLNLSYNDLIELPEGALRRMTKLTELYLSGNELTSLPVDDLDNIKSLKLLYLNNNKFVSLPAELSKLVNLQHLDVGSNQLKYNISNWPYDWNWHWNKKLKYLNFSGNKRFEIKQSHTKNPDTSEDFDSLLVLKNLKVLGLIDVTLTTTSVPDHTIDMRIRTTASELDNIGYGVSDTMGMRDHVSSRDVFIQKFRGNENEVLICSFDGKCCPFNRSHRISALAKNLFVPNFTNELNRLKGEEKVQDALRRTFLSMNKEINGVLSAKKNNCFNPSSQIKPDFADLNLIEDATAGCSVSIVYIKDKTLYTANIGDIETLLSTSNGDHILLTTKHSPTNRTEFERIRASGGYVSGDGALDGELPVSRGVGFFNYLPHTHSGPDISEIELTSVDDMIIMATTVLWNFISFELAVDILRQEKKDPMIAAQKLRDYAICYGASDKISVIVITLGEKKSNKMKFGSNALYNNLGNESDVFAKKRRDRSQIAAGGSTLRRLEEEIEPPEGELALVFTDIKNSTLMWDSYPIPMRSAIKIHNAIMRRQLRIVGGYEVKTEGDAFMVSFPSPTSALLWCFNVQQQLLKQDWPSEILETDQCCEVTDTKGEVIFRGLSVRMGIHWGSPVCELDYVTRRMDYFGPMVNRASRICTVADGGQIAVSSDFLSEINALYKIHEEVTTKATTIFDAYQGNVRAGEIIERELRSIEEHGCSIFELGDKKLKGLETPEFITLAYPKKLEVRFEIFKKRLFSSDDSNTSTRIVGTLPVESIYGLRTVSLRLENICSCINGGVHVNEGFQENSSDLINQKINTSFKESDLMGLLNHLVTRVENCAANLNLRQNMSLLHDNRGYIDFNKTQPISNIMDDLDILINTFQKLQLSSNPDDT